MRQQITLALTPSRLGLPDDSTSSSTSWPGRWPRACRARVASAGFLGTSLEIELVDLPDQPAAELDLAAQPYPQIPGGPVGSDGLMARRASWWRLADRRGAEIGDRYDEFDHRDCQK